MPFKHLWIAATAPTPLMTVWVAVSEAGLIAVEIGGKEKSFTQNLANRFGVPILKNIARTENAVFQIQEYLNGKRRSFDLPVDWSRMSVYQVRVYQAVCRIPYGETRTYSQIAVQIGAPRAQRAVGRANATNPIPLVIPCHRLIGADGSLRGYGGGDGIQTKAWLLELEKLHSDRARANGRIFT